jgi:CheY-like chemotaxis protein
MACVEIDPVKKCRDEKSVLIIDDNPAIRTVVAQAFLSHGFAICGFADNGKKALLLAKQLKPHLVILDLAMPIMNGLETAPELRKLLPITPIILLTLYGNGPLKAEASKAGIDLVLMKTESLPTLIAKARELMGD